MRRRLTQLLQAQRTAGPDSELNAAFVRPHSNTGRGRDAIGKRCCNNAKWHFASNRKSLTRKRIVDQSDSAARSGDIRLAMEYGKGMGRQRYNSNSTHPSHWAL